MRRPVTLAALLAAAACSTPAAAAPAPLPCSNLVADRAHALTPAMRAQAVAGARTAEGEGADVHVWFVRRLPAAGIDAFESSVRRRCESWRRAGSALRKPNLLVLIVGFEPRAAGLYWGERWSRSLDGGEADRLRASELIPNLREGQYGLAARETL